MTQPTDPHVSESVTLGLYAAFSGAGGVIGYACRTMQSGGSIKWARALTEGLSAAFIGIIVTFICKEMKLDAGWTGAIVGIAGWIGATASVKIIEAIVANRLGIKSLDPDTNREVSDTKVS